MEYMLIAPVILSGAALFVICTTRLSGHADELQQSFNDRHFSDLDRRVLAARGHVAGAK